MDANGIDLEARGNAEVDALTRAGTSNAQVGKDYMSGTNVGRGLLNQGGDSGQAIAYGSPMQHAIKQRYVGEYNANQSQLHHRVLRSASEDNLRNLSATTQMATEEVMQNRQKAMLKNEIEQANKRARGQVLGTVLGITGGVGAMAAGTGPQGGMAGYQAGSGVGQMIGGS